MVCRWSANQQRRSEARARRRQCVSTTTILSDPDADPHESQPTKTEVRAYQAAQLVIENGLGYDDFSDRILSTMSSQPALVRTGNVVGLQVGANPHIWWLVRLTRWCAAMFLSRLYDTLVHVHVTEDGPLRCWSLSDARRICWTELEPGGGPC